jgi:hypothetical protein
VTLEERLQRLEDDRAIRDLKARYLRACDQQDPETIEACLAEHAVVDYEGFPAFDNRAAFVAVYRQMGCVPGVFDIHHGANGIITFDDGETASGQWALTFQNINLTHRSITDFGMEYTDTYVKQAGHWVIARTRATRKSVLIQTVDADGKATIVALGESGAAFGAS